MSIKRRLVLLTEAQRASITLGCEYAISVSGDPGADITDRSGAAIRASLAPVDTAPIVAPKLDADALADVLSAACINSCSCVSKQLRGNPLAGESRHAKDCWNTTHRHQVDRVSKLIELLKLATIVLLLSLAACGPMPKQSSNPPGFTPPTLPPQFPTTGCQNTTTARVCPMEINR